MLRALLVTTLLAACNLNGLTAKSVATESAVTTLPEISGVDHRGRDFSLHAANARGPVLVVFYRGHW